MLCSLKGENLYLDSFVIILAAVLTRIGAFCKSVLGNILPVFRRVFNLNHFLKILPINKFSEFYFFNNSGIEIKKISIPTSHAKGYTKNGLDYSIFCLSHLVFLGPPK